jgi:hypothetical protein
VFPIDELEKVKKYVKLKVEMSSMGPNPIVFFGGDLPYAAPQKFRRV